MAKVMPSAMMKSGTTSVTSRIRQTQGIKKAWIYNADEPPPATRSVIQGKYGLIRSKVHNTCSDHVMNKVIKGGFVAGRAVEPFLKLAILDER